MKKAYLKELQGRLLGDVVESPEALEYFSTDSSIFQITPTAVVYPQNTADVRKTVQFVTERTAKGKPLGLVPRGQGTDLGGAAVGEGLQLVFPGHMNKLLSLDGTSVTVQPGIPFHTLQQTLHTHTRFLPPYPARLGHTTIGGAVATNSSGEKSVKYGSMRDYVKKLKVVLYDGSIIETHRLSARELNRKKGLSSAEGEVYRKLDGLLLDHEGLIKTHQPHTTKNTAGYALSHIRRKDGSFDLSQIFIGSQGTLGVITEVTLGTASYNPRTTLVVGYFSSLEHAGDAIVKLRALRPSALELVDVHLLEYLQTNQPGLLEGFVPEKLPRVMLFVEFDDFSQLRQKLGSNRALRSMARHGATVRVSTDPVEQLGLWKIRRSADHLAWASAGARKALPFIDDGVVPVDRLAQLIDKTYKLLGKHDLDIAVWGHAGDGNLHLQPFLDLSKKRDTDKLFSLAREYSQILSVLGGTTSGGRGDGLIRSLTLQNIYGEEMMELFASVKHIFDPQSIFNPMKKTQATEAYARAHLRTEYTPKHAYDDIFYP